MKKDEEYYIEISENDNKLILPSEKEKEKEVKKKKNSKKIKSVKYTSIILFIVLIYLFYEPLLKLFYEIMAKNPTIFKIYLSIENNIRNLTLGGLYIFSILSSIFFLVLPSEGTFIYYLENTNYLFLYIIFISLLGNITGMLFNYFFGRLLGKKLMIKFFGEKKFYKYNELINNKGGILLLIGNIFPGPIEVISVFFGGFKFPIKNYIYLVLIGRLIKYLILTFLYFLYWDTILYNYNIILDSIGNFFSFI